ncbi:MAG: VOC family protein [Actinomycetota bacterium]
MSIAEYRHSTLDCPDPIALAKFYAELLGLKVDPLDDVNEEEVEWLRILDDAGRPVIGFARIPNYATPTWPTGPVPQQTHLEFSVTDLDEAEAAAIAIGATKHEFQPGTNFRVYLDPVGHPFCLILNYND